ncbi:MAG: hypothetical protein A2Y25_00020 [Candidatus Melainabacteria bacterium GWF2_37_15]|nr:MAG: hypothetical protein A2Y25_00020 [Candidatus Melainabacteria bacterium GWF2_37_15]
MAPKHDKQSAEFKSGLFIIISLALLIFSIMWLRYFAITPDKKIIARFRDPGPVERGMPVYYQGVNVGKVPKIGFSKNFKYTYVYLDIYKKLELPANITAMVKTEGLAGQKYVNISYPEQPVDDMLANGDFIKGETPFGLSDIQELIKKEIESGRLEKMFKDIESTLANANVATAKIGNTSDRFNSLLTRYDSDINDIVKGTSGAVAQLNQSALKVNDIVESPEIKETLASINRITQATEAGTANVFHDIEQTSLIPNVNATVYKTYSTLEEAELTMQKAGQAACRYDAIGKSISNILGQRFLLFKLMFGKLDVPTDECEAIGQSP